MYWGPELIPKGQSSQLYGKHGWCKGTESGVGYEMIIRDLFGLTRYKIPPC